MRVIAALTLLLSSSVAFAANPVAGQSKLDPAWQAKTREFLKEAIETPSVVGRGSVGKVAELVAAQLKAGGFPASDMQIIPYEGLNSVRLSLEGGQSDEEADVDHRSHGRGRGQA